MTKVYLAGSVTNGGTLNPDQIRVRCDAFDLAERELLADGYQVVNPTKLHDRRPYEHGTVTLEDSQKSMRTDFRALLDCDTLMLLPGWQQSHYTQIELQVAVAVGIEVVYLDDPPVGNPYPGLWG